MTTLKTKITDLLDSRGIAYRVLHHTEPVFTVEAAAAQRGVVFEEMVKSQYRKLTLERGQPPHPPAPSPDDRVRRQERRRTARF